MRLITALINKSDVGALSIAHKKARVIGAQTPQRAFYQSKVIMQQLTVINQAVLTMTSREVAELVDSRHDKVKQSIERLVERGVLAIPPLGEYLDALGRAGQTQYLLDKRSSYIVVAQLSPEFTARLVDRWQELEAKQAAPAAALPQDYIQALESLLASKKSEQLAIEQRDHAIATKAHISDKKTATAMATASAKSREVEKLKDQLGFNARHATVITVEKATGKKFGKQDWRPLKAWCRANGASSVTVPCARYGKAQAWPAGAWGAVYGVDLVDLFGEVAA